MNDLKEKYARVLLTTCLKVEKNQPLFISANTDNLEFLRIVAKEAYKIGVKEIYFDITDVYLKHDALKNLERDDLQKLQFWNKEKWNEYASKGAAFLMLASENPGLMKDIDSQKINDLAMYAYETRSEFDALRSKKMVPWCIAAVPTESWAKHLFSKEKNPVEKLWDKIFDICLIREQNPEQVWNEKINKLTLRSQKLTSYQFKKLKYENQLGTKFSIELPENHIWASGREKLTNGKNVLVNYPTEEVFTSPTFDSASGIVYSAKPLAYQDNIIDEFWIKFEKGIAIDCGAKTGEETLRQLINSCPNANRLGKVALVEYDSPIANANIVFYETLYDENAACHLALGNSFPECIEGGENLSKEELINYKLNSCLNHVDFMIGTKDLQITGITADNREIPIFKNGNFVEEFK